VERRMDSTQERCFAITGTGISMNQLDEDFFFDSFEYSAAGFWKDGDTKNYRVCGDLGYLD
jgi:hypothetical protein